MNIPLFPCVPENLVSRDGFSRPVPRQPAHLHTQAESGAYLRDSSRVPRRCPFMKPPYAIGSVPSLSGHAIAYRWRSLPRVRRHRASKPQGSFERVLPWQITMDQLIFASLSHTHYWYEVGMLKVPAYQIQREMFQTRRNDSVVSAYPPNDTGRRMWRIYCRHCGIPRETTAPEPPVWTVSAAVYYCVFRWNVQVHYCTICSSIPVYCVFSWNVQVHTLLYNHTREGACQSVIL